MAITPQDARIKLRPRRAQDAQALFPTMSDPEMMRYWARAPFASVAALHENFDPAQQSGWRPLAITKKDDDLALGFVTSHDSRKDVAEIGYLLARDAQGHGFAQEALGLLITHLFTQGYRRVFADVDPDNTPSVKLLQKLGFTLEGRLRAEWETHIGVRDSFIFGLLVQEWKG